MKRSLELVLSIYNNSEIAIKAPAYSFTFVPAL